MTDRFPPNDDRVRTVHASREVAEATRLQTRFRVYFATGAIVKIPAQNPSDARRRAGLAHPGIAITKIKQVRDAAPTDIAHGEENAHE